MRRAALGLLLIAACGGGVDHPELHFDVTVTGSLLYVTATEVDRPDATSQRPFAHPDDCDETSDAWSCEGACPGQWLGELSLVRAGEVIDAVRYDAPWGSGFAVAPGDLDDAILVIEDVDGAEVEVPLPGGSLPEAIIDDVAVTDAGVSREDVAITWHTDAADSAVVEVSGGFGGPRCHVTRTDDVTTLQASAGSTIGVAMVTAFAAPVTVETAFGDAEVWVGDATSFDFRGTAAQ